MFIFEMAKMTHKTETAGFRQKFTTHSYLIVLLNFIGMTC